MWPEQALVGDRVVRFGGDEFVVIWEGPDVAELGRRLVAALAGLTVVDPDTPEVPIVLSVSAGSVLDADLPRALQRAEDAIQIAKQAGRGRAHHAG